MALEFSVPTGSLRKLAKIDEILTRMATMQDIIESQDRRIRVLEQAFEALFADEAGPNGNTERDPIAIKAILKELEDAGPEKRKEIYTKHGISAGITRWWKRQANQGVF